MDGNHFTINVVKYLVIFYYNHLYLQYVNEMSDFLTLQIERYAPVPKNAAKISFIAKHSACGQRSALVNTIAYLK